MFVSLQVLFVLFLLVAAIVWLYLFPFTVFLSLAAIINVMGYCKAISVY